MEFFNYVMVLASVIVGLAVTHLLQGVAKMFSIRTASSFTGCTWPGSRSCS